MEYKNLKITKKATKELLINNRSIFIGSYFVNKDQLPNMLSFRINHEDWNGMDFHKNDSRIVTNVKSNSIQFNNGSYLNDKDYKESYRIGNTVYLVDENCIMVYELKGNN